MRVLLLTLLLLSGCRSAPHALTNAAIGLAIGGTASAISRATGGCYSACVDGTVCDEVTGKCRWPCDGKCNSNEVCADDGRCVLMMPSVATSSDAIQR